jgi:hypothetical protein
VGFEGKSRSQDFLIVLKAKDLSFSSLVSSRGEQKNRTTEKTEKTKKKNNQKNRTEKKIELTD